MKNIDLKFRQEAVLYTQGLISKYGSDKASKFISDSIQNLSFDGEALSNTYQLLFYSLCLKFIKEN